MDNDMIPYLLCTAYIRNHVIVYQKPPPILCIKHVSLLYSLCIKHVRREFLSYNPCLFVYN